MHGGISCRSMMDDRRWTIDSMMAIDDRLEIRNQIKSHAISRSDILASYRSFVQS
jgi:hypothetical protein